jgi:hypothetical protein
MDKAHANTKGSSSYINSPWCGFTHIQRKMTKREREREREERGKVVFPPVLAGG